MRSATGAALSPNRERERFRPPELSWSTQDSNERKVTVSTPLRQSLAARPAAGGKSELHRARCRITSGGGNAEESATEKQTTAAIASAIRRQG
jgi:hypothetical protein